jgi:hypothetical protein
VSEGRAQQELGPYSFEMTEEDARVAASRAGLRAALSGRLSRNHVAPLVAFALLMAFITILTLTGLIGRRLGDGALILAAIGFMTVRMTAHWRLRGAQKDSLAAMSVLQESAAVVVRLDDWGLRMDTSAGSRQISFADCGDVEQAGEMIYLWPRKGEPAFVPTRAFADARAAQEFLSFVRAGMKRAAVR